jgi:hypothetical protein
MRRTFILFTLLLFVTASVQAQEKGVDQQNERIRESGANRVPAVNGGKTDTGIGRGIDFGKGKTEAAPLIPNPYRFSVPNDVLIRAVEELMREEKLVMDETSSKPAEGILISQPYTFTRGSVVATSELSRVSVIPEREIRSWTRGRYTLIVEVQPLDGTHTNVVVNARVEGRSDGVLGAEWVSLESTGGIEQRFLNSLIVKVTGAEPTPAAQNQ